VGNSAKAALSRAFNSIRCSKSRHTPHAESISQTETRFRLFDSCFDYSASPKWILWSLAPA